QLDDFAGGVVHQVGLGEGDDAVLQAEQSKDFEVFAGLGHDRVVGRDDEQGQVDAGGPGEHVLDEPLVPGAIDNAEPVVAEVEPGEPDVNGDAASLLFRQPIAVGAREGLDEGGLAVVNVAGCAEDPVAHVGRGTRESVGDTDKLLYRPALQYPLPAPAQTGRRLPRFALAMLNLPAANEILGAMITPALLISASGTLVLSTSNRLGRVVDRVRTLAKMAEELEPADGSTTEEVEDKRKLIADQLAKLTARILKLEPAITALYTAIGLLVAASISVGMVAVLRADLAWVPVAFGLVGACAMLYGSVLLVREARLAVHSTLHE